MQKVHLDVLSYLHVVATTLLACAIALTCAASLGLAASQATGVTAAVFWSACLYLAVCSILMPVRLRLFTDELVPCEPENFWFGVCMLLTMIIFWAVFEFLDWGGRA